jgi:hypothetical protein
MDGKRVTAEQILAKIGIDIERMAQKVADALNTAEAGAIIDQSEEPVRDAMAELRRQTYQKAIDLLSENQQDFSPSGRPNAGRLAKQRPADHDASDNERAIDG